MEVLGKIDSCSNSAWCNAYTYNGRTGRKCDIKQIRGRTAKVRSLIYNSLPNYGARLFNCLPKHIRDMTGTNVDKFKRTLDNFLCCVPDEPGVPGYIQLRQAMSNSLTDQVLCLKMQRKDQKVSIRSGPRPV